MMDGSIMTNGCGACSGFWKWLKPPHYNFFRVQCNIHDIMYNIGGTSKDRHIADVELLYNMKDWVNEYFKNRKPISRNWYLFLCNIYYLAVRFFGANQFNFTSRI